MLSFHKYVQSLHKHSTTKIICTRVMIQSPCKGKLLFFIFENHQTKTTIYTGFFDFYHVWSSSRIPSISPWFYSNSYFFFCHKKLQISYIINLSPSWDASPSLETLDGCLMRGRLAPGSTSSLLCTVNEDFPFEPKPNLRLRPLNPPQN